MDARTRHELKKNELAEMLSQLGRLASRRGRLISLVILLVIVLLVGWRFWQWNSRRTQEQLWQELLSVAVSGATVATPQLNTLRRIAVEATDQSIREWAELRLACGLLRQASADPVQHEPQVAEAVQILGALASPAIATPHVAAAAQYALASAYEFQGKFNLAREAYEGLADGERFAGSPFQSLARSRAAEVEGLSGGVALVAGGPPPTGGTPVPQPSETAPRPGSQPSPPAATTAPAASEPSDQDAGISERESAQPSPEDAPGAMLSPPARGPRDTRGSLPRRRKHATSPHAPPEP